MKNILSVFCCLFVLATLVGCGSGKPIVVQNETTKIIKETVHDTIFKIEKDSSYLEALLECQNGKVVIKNIIQSEPGRTLKSPKVRLSDNVIKVDCESRARELFAQWKDTYISQDTVTQLPPIITNELNYWQKTQIIGFRIYLGLTLLLAVWVYVKSKL
jgi:hypothetical protein